MDNERIRKQVKQDFVEYLTLRKHRKTEERYAILDHIYSFPKQYAAVKTDELLIKKAFDFYSLRKLKETYNNNLESNFPEFAHNLNEFKEGLVLFELLEQNIWNESAKRKFKNDVICFRFWSVSWKSRWTFRAHYCSKSNWCY